MGKELTKEKCLMDNGLLHEFREKINEDYMMLHIFRNKNNKNKWSVLCSAMDWSFARRN